MKSFNIMILIGFIYAKPSACSACGVLRVWPTQVIDQARKMLFEEQVFKLKVSFRCKKLRLRSFWRMVPRGGIEPPTCGFSREDASFRLYLNQSLAVFAQLQCARKYQKNRLIAG
jgi:hypothetical protein